MNARWDMAGRTGKLTRRQALHGGATLAIVAAAKAAFPSGAFAQGAGPETKAAKLGFIALTDAAPLFVAKEKGLFAKYGMPDVEVQSGILGDDARQPRARIRRQRHRRRSHPHADALPHQRRQGDA